MLAIAKLGKMIRLQSTLTQCRFAGDKWKDRDEASEKVYITAQERYLMKKLASKLQADPGKDDDSGDEFNRKLKEIMHRYKINNEAFASEILNLHLNLKD